MYKIFRAQALLTPQPCEDIVFNYSPIWLLIYMAYDKIVLYDTSVDNNLAHIYS